MTYGNPFPPNWEVFYDFVSQFTVAYVAPTMTGTYSATASIDVRNVLSPSLTVVPLVSPPTSPTIGGSSAFSHPTPVRVTPPNRGSAPTPGPAHYYTPLHLSLFPS